MQLPLITFGAKSGMEKVRPYREGDIVVKITSEGEYVRHVVTHVDSNDNGIVLLTVNLKTGNSAVVLEREIAYRAMDFRSGEF